MTKEGLLSDSLRATITNMEYGEISKGDIENLYIQEYGKLAPKFDVIESDNLSIGDSSGFNGGYR